MPNQSCWYLNPDILWEPLNKAVNEEVSSLNPSHSRPPHILTSGPHLFCRPLSCSVGGHSQLLASFPAPCWQCYCSQGTCAARPGCVPTAGYRTKRHQPPDSKSLLACCEEVVPPSHHWCRTGSAEMVFGPRYGGTGCFRNGEGQSS